MAELHTNLNILYVGVLPPHPGGAGISWSQLLVGFAAQGHTVRALAPITDEALLSGDAFAATHPQIHVARFSVPHYYTAVNVPASAEYRQLEHEQIHRILPKMIRDERPDIMVIGRESFALHVPDLARTHGIPSILGIRGNTAIAILNQTYPESAAREMLQQFAKATLLVSAARHMTEGLKALGFNAITTIPNAIDLNQFQPKPKDDSLLQALNLQAGDTIVAHVSNLKTVKRPLDIVHSAEQALARNDRLAYVIVGDGAHRGAMEDCCRKKRISERFRFVGWVQYPRIPDYINLADMVVMPSASEGLSRVYLESQACERLLLASDIPPAREVIADGETGLLFKMGDCGDLAAKTLLAAADPKLRADIARNARQRVQTHSLDAAVAAYLALFEDLVRRPR